MENNTIVQNNEVVENNSPVENQKREIFYKILDRVNAYMTLSILIDEIRGESLDETSYLRMKSALDFLIYEFSQMIELGTDRQISIDDVSAKEIADMAKVSDIDIKDIVIKNAIDIEIEFICKFVDEIVETGKELTEVEMVDFVKKQVEINKKIEDLYKN